jgi:hypothetical protein
VPGLRILPFADASAYDILAADALVIESEALGTAGEGGEAEAVAKPARKAAPKKAAKAAAPKTARKAAPKKAAKAAAPKKSRGKKESE